MPGGTFEELEVDRDITLRALWSLAEANAWISYRVVSKNIANISKTTYHHLPCPQLLFVLVVYRSCVFVSCWLGQEVQRVSGVPWDALCLSSQGRDKTPREGPSMETCYLNLRL